MILKETLIELRKKFPNDKAFGSAVAKLLKKDKELSCCLCKNPIEVEIETGWKYGHNPAPLGKNKDERCCRSCNESVVLPVRIGNMMGADIIKTFKNK